MNWHLEHPNYGAGIPANTTIQRNDPLQDQNQGSAKCGGKIMVT